VRRKEEGTKARRPLSRKVIEEINIEAYESGENAMTGESSSGSYAA
jgi:hypothetical protein